MEGIEILGLASGNISQLQGVGDQERAVLRCDPGVGARPLKRLVGNATICAGGQHQRGGALNQENLQRAGGCTGMVCSGVQLSGKLGRIGFANGVQGFIDFHPHAPECRLGEEIVAIDGIARVADA